MIAGVVSYMLLCWGGGGFRHIFIVVFLTEFTSPYSLNTQWGWHTSKQNIATFLCLYAFQFLYLWHI